MGNLSLPVGEFEDRLTRIRAKMAERGLAALIVTRPENMFFASGFRAAHIANRTGEFPAVIIPINAPPRLMTRALESEVAKCQWTASPAFFKDHENPYAILLEILNDAGVASGPLGIEERHLRLSQYRKLQAHLPNREFVDATGLIESVAAFPSKAEAACMARAARITDIGLQTGVEAVRPGAFPYEVIARIHEAMYAAGQSDFDKSLVAVWSGPQGGRMHDTLTTEVIKEGDVVTIEIMGVDTHYRAGSQGCVYVGKNPPDDICRAYDLVVAMHAAARGAVQAGRTAGDVFAAANAVYRDARGDDYYRRCGGSMGLTQFTLDLVKGRNDVLTPGVSLLIQTLVDDPVLLTCASTVIVQPDGFQEITKPLTGAMRTTG